MQFWSAEHFATASGLSNRTQATKPRLVARASKMKGRLAAKPSTPTFADNPVVDGSVGDTFDMLHFMGFGFASRGEESPLTNYLEHSSGSTGVIPSLNPVPSEKTATHFAPFSREKAMAEP
jgi:hypothetical protein